MATLFKCTYNNLDYEKSLAYVLLYLYTTYTCVLQEDVKTENKVIFSDLIASLLSKNCCVL